MFWNNCRSYAKLVTNYHLTKHNVVQKRRKREKRQRTHAEGEWGEKRQRTHALTCPQPPCWTSTISKTCYNIWQTLHNIYYYLMQKVSKGEKRQRTHALTCPQPPCWTSTISKTCYNIWQTLHNIYYYLMQKVSKGEKRQRTHALTCPQPPCCTSTISVVH